MRGRIDFACLKRDINLAEYAAFMGYENDRKKSTLNSIVMREGHTDKIIISRRGGVWVYFSVYDDRDNGNIIDFVKNRTGKSLYEIGRGLHVWLNGNIDRPKPGSYAAQLYEQKPDPRRIKRLFSYCSHAAGHTWLKSRGITEEVLKSPRFYGRVFQGHFRNAVFPHFKQGVVCGLELRNENTYLFVRGSEKTLWRSNIRKKDDHMIIAEAPVDAISYQILHSLNAAFYVATGGGISRQQSDIVRKAITDLLRIKKISLITDNDKSGDKLTNRLSRVINEAGYEGVLTRHSPDIRGFDWNDVLKTQHVKNEFTFI